MNFFKDIFPPFSERAKSPLYGSFIVSWLLWNWKIVFAVLFFKKEDLLGLNLVDFIKDKYLNIWDGLWYPLILSACYLLFLPWLDYWIIWYSEGIKRKKIDKKLEKARKHKVDGDLYYDLKLEFEQEREKILKASSELISAKADIKEKENQNLLLNQNITEIQKQQIDSNNRYNLLSNRHNLEKVFKGRWALEFKNKDGMKREEINIVGSEYRVIRDGVEKLEFMLKLIDVDLEYHKISFVKFTVGDGVRKPHSTVELDIISNDRFEGFENETIKCTYIRSLYVP